MNRDKRIKGVSKGEFRSKLSLEDILPSITDEFYFILNEYNRKERMLVMYKMPIAVPFMDYVFHIKVKSTSDKYLIRFIHDLMYFNQGIDDQGLKKMTSFIITSIVLFNKMIGKPCLTFEQVYPVVCKEAALAELQGVETNSDKIVVFEKTTMLTTKQRRELTSETRYYRNSYLHEEVIHNKALTLVDKYPNFAVGKRDVHTEVANRKGLKTYRSFNKHIADKTVKILEEALNIRKFKSAEEVEEFEKYQVLKDTHTTAEIAKELGISYSTIAKYSKIVKEFESRELL